MFVWHFLLILILIALNAFFVSVEFAAVASRQARIELLAEEGNSAAHIVKIVDRKPLHPRPFDRCIPARHHHRQPDSRRGRRERVQSTADSRIFNQIALPANLQRLASVLAALPLVISLIIITSLTVVFGEQVPKVATLHQPERVAMLAAQPMKAFTTSLQMVHRRARLGYARRAAPVRLAAGGRTLADLHRG